MAVEVFGVPQAGEEVTYVPRLQVSLWSACVEGRLHLHGGGRFVTDDELGILVVGWV